MVSGQLSSKSPYLKGGEQDTEALTRLLGKDLFPLPEIAHECTPLDSPS